MRLITDRLKTMLEELKPYEHVRPCRVRKILEDLEAKDKEIFIKALGDVVGYPANYLARKMTEMGVTLSDKSVNNHRQKRCSC